MQGLCSSLFSVAPRDSHRLCPGALHPVVDKAAWRWHRAVGSQGAGRSEHWAGVSTGRPALTSLGGEKRGGFLSFAKFSMTAVFSSSPDKLLL